jgi:hypothetical protein
MMVVIAFHMTPIVAAQPIKQFKIQWTNNDRASPNKAQSKCGQKCQCPQFHTFSIGLSIHFSVCPFFEWTVRIPDRQSETVWQSLCWSSCQWTSVRSESICRTRWTKCTTALLSESRSASPELAVGGSMIGHPSPKWPRVS